MEIEKLANIEITDEDILWVEEMMGGKVHFDSARVNVLKNMDSVDKNEEKWVGIEEAANHLGVNKDTIRNWIKKENGIPAHKIGKLWKFKLSELDEWVKSGKSAIE